MKENMRTSRRATTLKSLATAALPVLGAAECNEPPQRGLASGLARYLGLFVSIPLDLRPDPHQVTAQNLADILVGVAAP